MPLMASDQHVTDLFAKHLEPGESGLVYAYAEEGPPLWLQMAVLGAVLSFCMSKYYFVGLTDRRLLLMRLGANYKEKATQAYPLSDLRDVSAKKAFLGRTLRFTTPDGRRHRLLLRNKLMGLRQQKDHAARICQRLPKAGAIEPHEQIAPEPTGGWGAEPVFHPAPASMQRRDGRHEALRDAASGRAGFHALPRLSYRRSSAP